MNLDCSRVRIIIFIFSLIPIGDYCNINGIIPTYIIFKYFYMRICLNNDSSSSWYLSNYISFRSKIISIVINRFISKNPYMMAALLRDIRKIKYKNPASIIFCMVIKNISIIWVFDLNTSYIKFRSTIFYNNIFRLPNINPSIRCSNCYTWIY